MRDIGSIRIAGHMLEAKLGSLDSGGDGLHDVLAERANLHETHSLNAEEKKTTGTFASVVGLIGFVNP
jgi:hypothetical protein